jgi:hypothetical protein
MFKSRRVLSSSSQLYTLSRCFALTMSMQCYEMQIPFVNQPYPKYPQIGKEPNLHILYSITWGSYLGLCSYVLMLSS